MKKLTINKIFLVFLFIGIQFYMIMAIISLVFEKDILDFVFCLLFATVITFAAYIVIEEIRKG